MFESDVTQNRDYPPGITS